MPICKMKRCNPTSTSNNSCSTATATATAAATAASDEMKKRLEERTKQDQKYFPTLPLPSILNLKGTLTLQFQ